MKRHAMIILAALATAAAGCHKDNKNDALQNDLNLAGQANSQRSLDSISAVERGYAAPAPAASASRTATRTSTSSSPARRTTSSSSNGSVGTAPAPAPRTTVQKNTKRDAAV